MNLFTYIKQQLPIENVVGEYSTLKRAGSYLKGTCPFHNEKTASFTVSPDKDIFYCFGCHEGGDVISFISKVESCSQLEAAKILIERYALKIPENIENNSLPNNWKSNKNKEDKKNRYFRLCKIIGEWANKKLSLYKNSHNYLKYRNISDASINIFNIGYFPAGVSELKNLLEFIKKEHFLLEDLIEYAILIKSARGLYSPFEDRIMFPIQDHLGNTCGFGGRILQDTSCNNSRPKYYNSKENSFFNKKNLLFGLNIAKKEIQNCSKAFLVEGYTDVIAMVQKGYKNTIATLGTACSIEHLQKLSKYTEKLYILYDADTAGQNAILRLTELCFESNIDLYVTLLPKGEDPASFLDKFDNLDNIIEKSKDIFEYFISKIGENFNSKSTQEKLNITQNFINIIAKVNSNIKQELLLNKASNVFHIPVDILKKEIKKLNNIQSDKSRNKNNINETAVEKPTVQKVVKPLKELNTLDNLEKNLIYLIISSKIEFNNNPNKKLIIAFLSEPIRQIFKDNKEFEESLEISTLNNENKQIISKLILEKEAQNYRGSLEETIQQFYKKHWKRIVYNVKLKIKKAEQENNTEQISKLLAYLKNIKDKIIRGA